MGALPGAQTTDVLHQALGVGVGQRPVHVHAHLVHPVDELTLQGAQQVLLLHLVLGEGGGGRRVKTPTIPQPHSGEHDSMVFFLRFILSGWSGVVRASDAYPGGSGVQTQCPQFVPGGREASFNPTN